MRSVSIIIPTYKGSENIRTSVCSALAIKELEKEIIVVDDNGKGSDNQLKTFSALEDLIKEGKLIYLVHEKNKNGSAARNTGFKASSGQYIAFLDDDDYLFPDKLKVQIEQLENKGKEYGGSVTAGYYVHKNGRGYLKKIHKENDFLYNYMLDRNYFNTSALVIKREVIEKIGGFDESFFRHQDWEFCSRLLTITKICYINEPLFIKFAENRNVPSNIETRIEQLDYFHSKITNVWKQQLSQKQINIIKRYRYRQIFQGYIFQKKVIRGVQYLFSRGCSIVDVLIGIIEIIEFVIRRVVLGNKKVTYSYDEVKEKNRGTIWI